MDNIDVFKIAMLEKGIKISEIAELIKTEDKEIKYWLCGLAQLDQEKIKKIADYIGISRDNIYGTGFLQRIDSVEIVKVVAVKKLKRQNVPDGICFVETEYWDLEGNKVGESI